MLPVYSGSDESAWDRFVSSSGTLLSVLSGRSGNFAGNVPAATTEGAALAGSPGAARGADAGSPRAISVRASAFSRAECSMGFLPAGRDAAPAEAPRAGILKPAQSTAPSALLSRRPAGGGGGSAPSQPEQRECSIPSGRDGGGMGLLPATPLGALEPQPRAPRPPAASSSSLRQRGEGLGFLPVLEADEPSSPMASSSFSRNWAAGVGSSLQLSREPLSGRRSSGEQREGRLASNSGKAPAAGGP